MSGPRANVNNDNQNLPISRNQARIGVFALFFLVYFVSYEKSSIGNPKDLGLATLFSTALTCVLDGLTEIGTGMGLFGTRRLGDSGHDQEHADQNTDTHESSFGARHS